MLFLNASDPMSSTYMYVYRLMKIQALFETIPGITAFCAIGSHLGYQS